MHLCPSLPHLLCWINDHDYKLSGDIIHSAIVTPPPPRYCAKLLNESCRLKVIRWCHPLDALDPPPSLPYCAELLMLIEIHQVTSSTRRFWSPPPPHDVQSYWCWLKVIRWCHPLDAFDPPPSPHTVHSYWCWLKVIGWCHPFDAFDPPPSPPPTPYCAELLMLIESHQVMSSTRNLWPLSPILCRVTDANWKSLGDVNHSTLLTPLPPCCAELLMLIESHQVMSSTQHFWSPPPYCAELLMLIESHQVMSSTRHFWLLSPHTVQSYWC